MTISDRSETLDISVLIATRDRMQLLEATLGCLQCQNLINVRWEVIVVNNGSKDNTLSVLSLAREKLPLIILDEPLPGKNRALNRALNVARGDLIIFTDDDVELTPQWLSELFAASGRWKTYSIFCGPIVPIYPAETPIWLRNHPYAAPAYAKFLPMEQEGLLPLPILPYGPNYAVRAGLMAGLNFCTEIGPGTDYPVGDETELLMRLRAQGERAIYVPSASVKHQVRKHQIEPKWLLQRAFNFGRGEVRLNYNNYAMELNTHIRKLNAELSNTYLVLSRSTFNGDQARFEVEAKYHFLRGQIYEYHKLTSEQRM